MTIAPATSLGAVELTVAELDAQAAFYRDAIGLREIRRVGDTVELGVPGGDTPLVSLVGRPDAPRRPPRTTGLFHLALLVPSRADLARTLHRVTGAGHRFTGASDHLVSEALYLDDPEGNGIEIYCDRPREDWPYVDGQLEMATLPLDVEGILASIPSADAGDGIAAGTRIGHVHLQVAALPAAEAFYVGALGFEPTVRALSGRAVRLSGRLPPPPRAQHLGGSGSTRSARRLARDEELHDRVPRHSRAPPHRRGGTRRRGRRDGRRRGAGCRYRPLREPGGASSPPDLVASTAARACRS